MKTSFISKNYNDNTVTYRFNLELSKDEIEEALESASWDNEKVLSSAKRKTTFEAELSLEDLGYEGDPEEDFAGWLENGQDEFLEEYGFDFDEDDIYEAASEIIQERPEKFREFIDQVYDAYLEAVDDEFLAIVSENGRIYRKAVKAAA